MREHLGRIEREWEQRARRERNWGEELLEESGKKPMYQVPS